MSKNSSQPEIYDSNGELLFRLPDPGREEIPVTFLFSLPKAGSTMLYEMAKHICAAAGVTYVSFPDHFFALGTPELSLPAECSRAVLPNGYCYGGFRLYPKHLNLPFVKESKKVLLIRDPRDMLVSNYFSVAQSHVLPGEASSIEYKKDFLERRRIVLMQKIDEYVLGVAAEYEMMINSYDELLMMNNLKIVRYEDYVYHKSSLVKEITEFFGWTVDDDRIAEIAASQNIIPIFENEAAHIRQVHPGNHKLKLLPETINRLNERFGCFIQKFKYNI